ncbi:hypothetical protein BLD48_06960 [Exiguobacterium sp. KRL4]|uniref:abortive infection family protein n=1 Tax=Exiguobacterium sp. KRL4 TaxID=1914536 RepID=UPI0008F818D4|nr:abortive infection family protein [Exiguobacterium sp. KRL4]OIN67357.1 hypothetical protein BLD48_06960 [Exiguobacterium sp. KRL4]
MYQEIFDDVMCLQNIMLSHATGEKASDYEYRALREKLMSNIYINSELPSLVKNHRNLPEFWNFISQHSEKYKSRRTYIYEAFKNLLASMEEKKAFASPMDAIVSDIIEKVTDYESVQRTWQKALDRRNTDPDGAITIARTLLELTCKHIMDEAKYEYNDKAELPLLYKGVQEVLNLAPSEHTEQVFKEILSGCISVVKGLGSLRNKLSDAHGRSRKVPSPSPRHAQFAVNIAGSTAGFLISSWEEKKGRENK